MKAPRRAGPRIAALLVGVALLGSLWLDRGGPEAGSASAGGGGAPPDIPIERQRERVRVEVLNGAGDAGAAARVTNVLRDAGFDVKTYGNAASFGHGTTVVIDRSGRADGASEVARALGEAEVRVALDSSLYLDATVVLGSDWRERLPPP